MTVFDLVIKNVEIPKSLQNKWLQLRAYVRVDGGKYSIEEIHLFSEEEGYPSMSKKRQHGNHKTQD